ncbi:hypothetical protein HWV62_35095 [Athelia sp. TMB]|nr:hypothetical protein HWV62_35095 [Athelia sp. TMB]
MPRNTDLLRDLTGTEEKARKLAKTNTGDKVNQATPDTSAQELQDTAETIKMSSTGTPRNRADPENDITDPDFQLSDNDPYPSSPSPKGKQQNPSAPPVEEDDLYATDDRENTPVGGHTAPPPGSPNANANVPPVPPTQDEESGMMLLARIKRLPQEITDEEFISRAKENNTQLETQPEEQPPSHDNLVPTPPGGWPTVHGRVPTITIDNVDPQQVQLYFSERSRVMVAQPFGTNSWDAEKSGDIANAIAKEIQTSFDAPTVAVSPANEDKPTSGLNGPPFSYFVTDIPDEAYWALLEKECIASRTTQFIIRPLKRMGPNSYMGCIMGLVNVQNLTEKREDQLLDDIRELFYKNKTFYDATLNVALEYIESLPKASSPPPEGDADVDMSPENDPDYFVHDLLGDLKIEVLPIKARSGTLKPAVNLYLRIPGASQVAVAAVWKAIAGITYHTSRFGKGYYQASWKCNFCRGIDHPTGLCPFPQTPGWAEVTAPTAPASDQTQQSNNTATNPPQDRGDSRGRGGRGGSRGGRGGNANRGRGRGIRGN